MTAHKPAAYFPSVIRGMDDNRRVALLEDGILDLQMIELQNDDMQRIVEKLKSGARSQPYRKCRKLEGKEDVISKLSSQYRVKEIRIYGNAGITDITPLFLASLPSSVISLNMSYCSITVAATITICTFLQRDERLKSLNLQGNMMNDNGAKAVGKMLSVNKTLQNLRISESMSTKGYRYVGEGLRLNKSLRHFGNFRIADPEIATYFASVLKGESSLEYFCLLPSEYEEKLDETIPDWEAVVSQNESIKYLGCDAADPTAKWNKVQYWLDLNKRKARQVTREGEFQSFVTAVAESAELRKPSVVFYLLVNNVKHLQHIHESRDRTKQKRKRQVKRRC
eukprot:scaffold24233_cov117-Cylindrotheca_fusiformis.AAC.1